MSEILSTATFTCAHKRVCNCGVYIPPEYIEGVNNIRVAISCSKRLDPKLYHQMAQQVKHTYFQAKLNYYPICPSTHKAIEHGSELIKFVQTHTRTLSIGDFSETPIEVCVTS